MVNKSSVDCLDVTQQPEERGSSFLLLGIYPASSVDLISDSVSHVSRDLPYTGMLFLLRILISCYLFLLCGF